MARWALLALPLPLACLALRTQPRALLQTTEGLRERHRHVFDNLNAEVDIQDEFDPFAVIWRAAQRGASLANKAVGTAISSAATLAAPMVAVAGAAGGSTAMAAGAISKSAQALIDASDPDMGVEMEDLVFRRGYTVERHRVITEDGYILIVFRIPHGRNASAPPAEGRSVRPAILLQHGILDSSFAYVANFGHQSLAYILADAGYDVWLGNNRGNRYSKSHVSLSPLSSQFWNFSWSEMAEQDLPAEVDYILNHTGGSRLAYVGHSEGTTQAFAALAWNTDLASKISVFVALAPAVFVESVKVPFLRAGAALGLDKMVQALGDGVFYHTGQAANSIMPVGCQALTSGCSALMEVFAGRSEHLNESRIHVYATMFPAGTSTKNVRHWVTGLKKYANFGRYDYLSPKDNFAHYGVPYAPEYNLSRITVPMALFSGGNDQLADPEDVERLLLRLPPHLVFKFKQLPSYAHLDFILAHDANELLYPEVLAAIASHLP
mmetsp:Transcript_23478/g.67051  ORF Transcript_23478/g.67051 Transcript_23478/m.67051 type:complete len:494 (-) Transcript_23478:115-1596(-)